MAMLGSRADGSLLDLSLLTAVFIIAIMFNLQFPQFGLDQQA